MPDLLKSLVAGGNIATTGKGSQQRSSGFRHLPA